MRTQSRGVILASQLARTLQILHLHDLRVLNAWSPPLRYRLYVLTSFLALMCEQALVDVKNDFVRSVTNAVNILCKYR